MTNADPIELEKFSQLAHRWWDRNSEFKPLQHDECQIKRRTDSELPRALDV